jgi:hypothetical protein
MGTEKAKDVMCVRTQKLRGFKVERLPKEFRASHESLYSTLHGQHEHDAFEERLSENTMTPYDQKTPPRSKSDGELDCRLLGAGKLGRSRAVQPLILVGESSALRRLQFRMCRLDESPGSQTFPKFRLLTLSGSAD